MAKVEDKTQEIIPFLQGKLNGYRVDRGLTVFEDHTKEVGLWSAKVTTGYKDLARGTAEIVSVALIEGAIQKIDTEVPGIPILWGASITFEIRYKANTHGERWGYPGGAKLDNIWGSNDCAGSIIANIKMTPQYAGILTLTFNVNPDAPNGPGNFVKDYIAPLFRDAIDNTLEQFTGTQIN